MEGKEGVSTPREKGVLLRPCGVLFLSLGAVTGCSFYINLHRFYVFYEHFYMYDQSCDLKKKSCMSRCRVAFEMSAGVEMQGTIEVPPFPL